MTNHPAYLEVLYALWWAGLAAVPVNAKLHPEELAYITEHAGAELLFGTPDHAADAARLPVRQVTVDTPEYEALFTGAPLELTPRAPDDLAWLFYTSGTTGRPKGVMQTHRNLRTMVACYFAEVDAVSPDDVSVYAAPMSHGAGIYNFMYVLRGARHVIPRSGGFDPAELAGLARDLGGLCLFAAPTMVRRLVDHLESQELGGEGFKTIVYGGGPMYDADLRRALEVMGERFVQIYGQGESPMCITVLPREEIADRTHPRWAARLASVGHAQAWVEVQVAGPDGKARAPGEVGEVLVRGESVMRGYWRDPEATAYALRGGWLHTGDLGALDEDGYLTLHDRSKDVIISGGSNIYPREVEEALLRHPGVQEVSVVGQPDPEWGEVVVAFVVAPGVGAPELDQLCLNHIARFKRPKHYHFVGALPKNNYGKVLKTELRTRLRAPRPEDA